MKFSKQHIATFLAILFHVSGVIGVLFTPYKDWFIQNTPLNLGLMVLLLLWTQEEKNTAFFLFFGIVFLTGMGVEMIGVNTARLFGSYVYGTILGPKLNGTPWLIGLNWFVVIYSSATVMQIVQQWFSRKMETTETALSPRIAALSFIVDGALLATFFDWVMEPVAMKLGFWQWTNTEVPAFNYICWFLVSAALLLVMRFLRFERTNHFAVHLLIIQLLFFLALRTYLPL
ncbi:MAG: carotenoid biosynthesis protein [Bacteroidota bacterium]